MDTNDAEGHTHKATSWELKELWAKAANERLERTGDEGRAIRETLSSHDRWKPERSRSMTRRACNSRTPEV